jgi:high-affinity iron transporter
VKKLFPFLIAGAIVAVACTWPGWSFAASEYEPGKNIYETKCIFCHGETGMGNGPAAPSFGRPPANLTDEKLWTSNPDKKITQAVTRGYGSMPAMELGSDQIKALLLYMSHAFRPGK